MVPLPPPCPGMLAMSPGIFNSLTLVPDNGFPNKIAPRVPNYKPRNPPFCFFVSFSIVSSIVSSRDLIIFMISLIYLFEIISVFIPDSNVSFE